MKKCYNFLSFLCFFFLLHFRVNSRIRIFHFPISQKHCTSAAHAHNKITSSLIPMQAFANCNKTAFQALSCTHYQNLFQVDSLARFYNSFSCLIVFGWWSFTKIINENKFPLINSLCSLLAHISTIEIHSFAHLLCS